MLRFLFGCIFALIAGAGFGQARRALLIGIDHYYFKENIISTSNSLQGCVNDARSVSSLLRNRFGFKEGEIKQLYNKEATKKNIMKGLQDLKDRAKKGDIVFIYYAGHGMTLYNSRSDKNFHNQCILAADVFENGTSIIRDYTFSNFYNSLINTGVILTSIFDCCYSGQFDMSSFGIRERMPEETSRDIDPRAFERLFAEYNEGRSLPNDTMDLKEAPITVKPAFRKASNFLFIAAAEATQKSRERRDISGLTHGLFTQALIREFEKLSAAAPVGVVFKGIQQQLAGQFIHKDYQNPVINGDVARLRTNLLGMPATNFSELRLPFVPASGNSIWLMGGAWDGLAAGNLFDAETGKCRVEVTRLAGTDSAFGVVRIGSLSGIPSSTRFRRVDNFARTKPRLKVYIPQEDYTMAKTMTLFEQKVKPLLNDRMMVDYNDLQGDCMKILLTSKGDYYHTANEKEWTALPFLARENISLRKVFFYFIYLPVPAEISAGVRKNLAKNQNVEIVSTPEQADLMLYMTYSKNQKAFIFTWSDEQIVRNFPGGTHQPESLYMATATLPADTQKLTRLVNDIGDMALRLASYQGHWLNPFPRR